MDTTVQRWLGTCQICEGEFKLDQGATLVHHGYKRPGHGYIVGDCSAVGKPAYEQSCEYLKQYVVALRDHRANEQKYLQRLESGEVQELRETVEHYRRAPETRTYKPGDPDFARVLRSKIYKSQNLIEELGRDIARCEQRIAAWRPLPIRTIEEAQAEKRASKDAAHAAREAKRQAKLAEKVASYQKRLDSAVRRRTLSTISDIFENAPSKLRQIAGYDRLSKPEALALIGRDHVWAAFELSIENPSNDQARRLANMYFDKAYPWPEKLT